MHTDSRLSKKAAQQTCHLIANYKWGENFKWHCSSLNQLLRLPSTWMMHRFLSAFARNLLCTWFFPGPGFSKYLVEHKISPYSMGQETEGEGAPYYLVSYVGRQRIISFLLPTQYLSINASRQSLVFFDPESVSHYINRLPIWRWLFWEFFFPKKGKYKMQLEFKLGSVIKHFKSVQNNFQAFKC